MLEGLSILLETNSDIKNNEKLSTFKNKLANETIIIAKKEVGNKYDTRLSV